MYDSVLVAAHYHEASAIHLERHRVTHNLNQYLNVDTNKLYFSQLDSVLTSRVLISGVPPSGQTSHFESLKRISSV
jgi:hypothetical protein